MKTFIKSLLSLFTIVALVGVSAYYYFGNAFGIFDKDYTVKELEVNFHSKQQEIYEVKRYLNSILPANVNFHIGFKNGKELSYFNIEKNDTYYTIYDNSSGAEEVDSLLNILGWKRDNLAQLKTKLNNANCMSIDKRDHFEIGFMGMYYFQLLEKPMCDSVKNTINKDCIHIYNDSVLFKFRGGIFGIDCFPKTQPTTTP